LSLKAIFLPFNLSSLGLELEILVCLRISILVVFCEGSGKIG
jgi:hypothetical protein